MRIEKVVAGESVSMPLVALGKGGGVTRVKSLIDGLLITLSPEESQCGILFVSADQLREVGYFTIKYETVEGENEEG